MECEEMIRSLLDSLDVLFESAQKFSEAEFQCVKQLAELDDTCSDDMIRMARDLMQRSAESERSEYEFQVLLQALSHREYSGLLELTAEALMSEKTVDKESYVSFIVSLEDHRAIPALIHLVASHQSTEDEEGWAVSKAINALRVYQATQASSIIIPRVMDISDMVRMAAIKFLIKMDIKSAAETFAEQLRREDDPDILRALTDGLRAWSYESEETS